MYQPRHNCFRRDLVVVADTSSARSTQRYLIKNPSSGEMFEFGPEEIYLCQLMDGELTTTEIISRFEEQFKHRLELSDFEFFANFLERAGLLAPYQEEVLLLTSHNGRGSTKIWEPTSNNGHTKAQGSYSKNDYEENPYRFVLFNPNLLFKCLAIVLWKWLGIIFKPLLLPPIWSLLPVVMLAALTLLYHWGDFWTDLTHFIEAISFFQNVLIGVLTVNVGSQLVEGMAIVSNGGTVEAFGIELIFGFFPLFFISKQGTQKLNRQEKLQVFSSTVIFKLNLLSFCILAWFSGRASHSSFVPLALSMGETAFLGLLTDISPFWKSNGYFWLTTYFNIYRLYDRAMQFGEMIISRRPLPKNLSSKERLILWTYVILFTLLVTAVFLTVSITLVINLEARFQGTGIVLFCLLLVLILRWYFTMNPLNKTLKETTSSSLDISTTEKNNGAYKSYNTSKFKRFLNHHKFTICGGFVIAIISVLPYQYHPGGNITLLPPKQQDLQPNISGRIVKVFTRGGDGTWLKKGTVIAEVDPSRQKNPATPIEDDVSIIREEIRQQKANLEKQKSTLNQLLTTPRKDEVDIAAAQLREAQNSLEAEKQKYKVLLQELDLAKQQLKTAQKEVEVAEKSLAVEVTNTKFRESDSARQKELYAQGAVSLQTFEDAERQAADGRDTIAEKAKDVEVKLQVVEEQERNVASKEQKLEEQKQNILASQQNVEEKRANLSLTLSGPHPDEIQAARHNVEVAQAQVREKEEDLKSTEKQLQLNDLVMPFDGRIITPFLDQKVDTYIEQGTTFAVAEDDRHIRGQIQIAETDVGEFDIHKPVTVKLSAYPNQTLEGRILSIEPATTDEENSRFVNVEVDLPNFDRLLKSGMTGHAKIHGEVMPVIVVFTRPIVRFFQIEVWSWIP